MQFNGALQITEFVDSPGEKSGQHPNSLEPQPLLSPGQTPCYCWDLSKLAVLLGGIQ